MAHVLADIIREEVNHNPLPEAEEAFQYIFFCVRSHITSFLFTISELSIFIWTKQHGI